MSNNRLIHLLTKKKSGVLTPEEQLELLGILNADEESANLARGIDEVFESTLSYGRNSGFVNEALSRIHRKMEDAEKPVLTQRKISKRTLWLAAASLIFILGSTVFYLMSASKDNLETSNVVITKKGSKTNLVLPDNTRVWVNADTKLTYDKNFGAGTREVTLVGEAYFEVMHDDEKPFIVHTKSMDIRVLGTSFNVRAYGDEANSQATLIKGSIEVLLKNKRSDKIVLKPREKISVLNNVPNESPETEVQNMEELELLKVNINKPDSLATETQWTRNRLVFDEERLQDIIPVLERWYNVSIEQAAAVKADRLFSGTFENDSLEDVLESLKAVGGFSYTIKKDKVFIF